MNRAALVIGAMGLGLYGLKLAADAAALNQDATTDVVDAEPSFDVMGSATAALIDANSYNPFALILDNITTNTVERNMLEPNVSAFLAMIRRSDAGTFSDEAYRRIFWTKEGPNLLTDFSDHPRIAKRFWNKQKQQWNWTSAAGAYQFMAVSPIPGTTRSTTVNTWDRYAKKLGLSDFSPENQDRAAVAIISDRGALEDVRAGRLDAAIRKVAPEWASLPGAGYEQPEQKLSDLRAWYVGKGGALA
jgi:muramidase (phage lysozyme)